MNPKSLRERLAVCSWSLQPAGPQPLIEQLKTLGIPRVQIALDPVRTQPGLWDNFADLAAQNGIQIVSGMLATMGEDYSTMETIRLTGGLVPDATWEENWENLHSASSPKSLPPGESTSDSKPARKARPPCSNSWKN